MDIEHISKLARLHLTQAEKDQYAIQLGSILEYVDKLQEPETDDVEELQHAIDVQNVFREDVVEDCEQAARELLLTNFSNRKDDLLQVQGVFDV